MATTVSSPCQMPGSQAIMFVRCSKSPKLTLPLLTMGEDHAASSPDWESGRHWHMEVVSAHCLSAEGGHCLGTSYTGGRCSAKTAGLWFQLL